MDREIAYFRCKECREIVARGKCGSHRLKTRHEEFEVIYGRNSNEERSE